MTRQSFTVEGAPPGVAGRVAVVCAGDRPAAERPEGPDGYREEVSAYTFHDGRLASIRHRHGESEGLEVVLRAPGGHRIGTVRPSDVGPTRVDTWDLSCWTWDERGVRRRRPGWSARTGERPAGGG